MNVYIKYPGKDTTLHTMPDLNAAIQALAGPYHSLVAIGAGGKSSLIFALGEELRDRGRKTIITTTTHLMPLDPHGNIPCLYHFDPGEAKRMLARHGWLLGGILSPLPPGSKIPVKLSGWRDEEREQIAGLCDVMLIEGDGSAALPLKYPDRSYEPQIPAGSDIAPIILNASCLGLPMETVCHRYALFRNATRSPAEQLVRPDTYRILWEAYLEDAAEAWPGTLLLPSLSHVDGPRELDAARQILEGCEYPCLLYGLKGETIDDRHIPYPGFSFSSKKDEKKAL